MLPADEPGSIERASPHSGKGHPIMKLLIPSARSAALAVLAVLLPVPAAVAPSPIREPFYPADRTFYRAGPS
jgi:hypothetical protein